MFKMSYIVLDPFRGEQNNLMWKGVGFHDNVKGLK